MAFPANMMLIHALALLSVEEISSSQSCSFVLESKGSYTHTRETREIKARDVRRKIGRSKGKEHQGTSQKLSAFETYRWHTNLAKIAINESLTLELLASRFSLSIFPFIASIFFTILCSSLIWFKWLKMSSKIAWNMESCLKALGTNSRTWK